MRQARLLFVITIVLGGVPLVTPAQQPASSTDASRKCVVVIGAVHTPGRFELKRRTRLMEVIVLAGGYTEAAGQSIHIMSTGGDCPATGESKPPVTDLKAPAAANAKVRFYRIEDLNTTDEIKNPYVEAGDIVVVVEGEQAYVTGAVIQPRAITLRKTVTLTQAIAMAGGLVRDARTDKVRIIRLGAAGTRIELTVDLSKIRKGRAEDVTLQPNDIVEVSFRHSQHGPITVQPGGIVPARVIY